ncbi:MAG: ROK family protein [Planctomycetota bacterium]
MSPTAAPCPCGQSGCFERYASANAVAERLVEAVEAGEDSVLAEKVKSKQPFDARDVIKAADSGDQLARRIWDETCRYLALGCINIEHLFNPELVVLAGGMINAGQRLLDPVREHFSHHRWKITRAMPEIVPATLGNDAGIIGAAILARQASV